MINVEINTSSAMTFPKSSIRGIRRLSLVPEGVGEFRPLSAKISMRPSPVLSPIFTNEGFLKSEEGRCILFETLLHKFLNPHLHCRTLREALSFKAPMADFRWQVSSGDVDVDPFSEVGT